MNSENNQHIPDNQTEETAPQQETKPEQGLDEKIKNIAMAGIGAVVDIVEKSRDVLAEFANSDKAKEWAQKGEEAVHSVAEAGTQALQKVKNALSEAELKNKADKQMIYLKELAQKVSRLGKEEREMFQNLLHQYDTKESQNENKEEPTVDPHE